MSAAPPPWRRAVVRAWPWLAVVFLATAVTSNLWRFDQHLFSERLFVDGVTGAWLYGDTARALARGELPHDLGGWDWPCARDRLTAPNWWDAAVVAPLAWLLPWPTRWGAQLAAIVVANALGVAALARALGARGWTLVVAGALGTACAPLWHELQAGRINGAWTGPAFATLAALAAAAEGPAPARTGPPGPASPTRPDGPARARGAALLAAAAAALLGAFTLGAWPLHAALLAPAGAALVLPALRRGRLPGLLLVVLALGAGLGLAWPLLQDMLRFKEEFYRQPPRLDAGGVWCIHDDGIASGRSLLRLWVPGDGGFLRFSSAALGSWLALPAALLAPRRARAVLVGAWGVALALLAMGPCPAWATDPSVPNGVVPASPAWSALWARLSDLHRMERLLSLGLGLVAAAGAAGLQGLRDRGGAGALLAPLLGLLGAGHATTLLLLAVLQSQHYQRLPETAATAWLARQPPAVVAVLPFDGSQQYLDALADPRHRRLNPYQVELRTRSDQPLVRWLKAAGLGDLDQPRPTASDLPAAGIDHVLFSPSRCASSVIRQPGACDQHLPGALREVLGAPTDRLADGGLVWTLAPAPGAAAALEATCGVGGQGAAERVGP